MTDENIPAPSEEQAPAMVPSRPDGASELATPAALAAFEERFLRLLERRTAMYTMGESTSVPTHVAADLLRSISFVLGIDPARPEIPEELLGVDLEDEFRRRLDALEREVALCEQLLHDAKATKPHIESIALRDTLASIAAFPRVYDFRSMAHEIPVMIDYPLCHPVPEELLGVAYINEYLRRMLVEFDLLRRFAPAACMRVLEHTTPEYADLLVNLYEPVAANVIGRALLSRDPMPLTLSAEERAAIARLLAPLSEAGRRKALHAAALAGCDAMGIEAPDAREYLASFALELLPRIDVALRQSDPSAALAGVFG